MDLKKCENTVMEERNQRMRMVNALQANSAKLQVNSGRDMHGKKVCSS